MFKVTNFLILILVLLFLFSSFVSAGNYLDGVLLRAENDIKVYLISDGTKRWVSSIEVFNLNNYKWQNVKVVSKKEVATIKDGNPIVIENTTTPIPTAMITPIPPTPVKINPKFPALNYVRADWLVSHATSNYGRIGQRIVFKYSDEKADKIENFRLYEKKPGDLYFIRVATFEEISSTGCEDIDIDGEWMITEAGQCGYWSIQRVVFPGGRDKIAHLPATNYLTGEYSYYVAGADKDGLETRPSPETKLVLLNHVDILSPIDKQQTAGIYPIFRWSIANGWPLNSVPDYFVMFSDDKNIQNPIWAKQTKVSPQNKSDETINYDGLGLDSTKKYKVYIYGHYRQSEYDPDYISISSAVPEFWVKSSNSQTSFREMFKALLLNPFDLFR